MDFVFMMLLGSKEISYHYFSSIKINLNLTFILKLISKLQIDLLPTQILPEKGPNCVKTY